MTAALANHRPMPGAAVADMVMSNIAGCTEAQRLVYRLRQGCAPQDALHEALQAVLTADDETRCRGFCRELQKALERSA